MPANNEFREASQHTDYLTAVAKGEVEEPRQVEIAINPADHGGADLLCIYTGVVIHTIQGTSANDWTRKKLHVPIDTVNGRKWTSHTERSSRNRGSGWTEFYSGTAIAAPAAIFNGKITHGNLAWAVDGAWVEIAHAPEEGSWDEYLRVTILTGVHGTDSQIFRLSYQVTVLGQDLG